MISLGSNLGTKTTTKKVNCISLLRLLKQNTTDWVAQTTESCFLVLGSRSPRSRCQQVWDPLCPVVCFDYRSPPSYYFVLTWLSLCGFVPHVSLPLLIRRPVMLGEVFFLTASFELNHLFKDFVSK